jgi:hypothetical protein
VDIAAAVLLVVAGFFAGVAWSERKAGNAWLDAASLGGVAGILAAAAILAPRI